MMLPNFSERSDRDEWMDDLSIPADTLRETTDAVERINRWTGGLRPSLKGLEALLPAATDTLTVLDVGTGNGAVAREFVEWGLRQDVDVHATGIDLIESAIAVARRRARPHRDALDYAVCDLFELDATRRFDIVHASLVLHHFPGDRAVAALRKMAELAELGVVINDLHRHPLHWMGSKLVVPALSRNRLARHDGPVSVLRGFTRPELRDVADRAGLPFASVAWEPPFRWLLTAPV